MPETSSARRDPGHPKSRSDMGADLVISIGDLAGDLEREREFSGTREVSLRLGDSTVKGPMTVTGVVVGTVDGVQASPLQLGRKAGGILEVEHGLALIAKHHAAVGRGQEPALPKCGAAA